MIWRWSLIKDAMPRRWNDDDGNDAASQWLAQNDPSGATQTATVPAVQPQVDTNPPPTFNQQAPAPAAPAGEVEPGIDLNPTIPGEEGQADDPGAVAQRKQRESAITQKWQTMLSAFATKASQVFQAEIAQNPNIGTGIYKALGLLEGTARYADWRKWLSRAPAANRSGGFNLLPEQLRAGGMGNDVVDTINQELENSEPTELPSSLMALGQAIASKDPELLRLFEEAGAAASSERGGSGQSGNTDFSADGKGQVGDLWSAETDKRRQNDNTPHMEQATIDALDDIGSVFLQSPNNQQYLQSLLPLVEVYDKNTGLKGAGSAQEKLQQAVQMAFKSNDNDPNDPTDSWVGFFAQNRDLLPGSGGNVRSYLDDSFGSGNQQIGFETLKELATNGDPRLQQYMDGPIKEAIENLKEKDRVEFRVNWANTNKDVRQLGRVVRAALLREMKRKMQTGDDFSSAGRRYFMMKNKMNVASTKLNDLLTNPKSITVLKAQKKGDVEYRVLNIGNGRIALRKPDGTEKELTPDMFHEMSRLVSPEEWVPKVIQDMKKSRPDLLKRPTDEGKKSPLRKEFDAVHQQFIEQAGEQANDPNFDRLQGYRQAVGQKLQQTMQQAGVNPQDIVEFISRKARGRKAGGYIKENPEAFINAVITGAPQKYSANDMGVIGKAIAAVSAERGNPIQPPDPKKPQSFFFAEPPEWDGNYDDDGTNMGELVGQSFLDYAPTLIHRKREADWRGSNYFGPNAMQLFLNIARVHANLFRGAVKAGGTGERQYGKLLMELTDGVPAGLTEEVATGEVDDAGDPVTVRRPLSPESAAQLLEGINHPDIYQKMPAPRHIGPNDTFTQHEYRPSDQGMARHTHEPDLTELGGHMGVNDPDTGRPFSKMPPTHQRTKKQKEQMHSLYKVLHDPSESPDRKQQAAKKLKQIRDEINKLPLEHRKKFPSFEYPTRPMYDEMGNPTVVHRPRKAESLDRILTSIKRINKLCAMKGRMDKFAGTDAVDTLIDSLVAETLSLIEE